MGRLLPAPYQSRSGMSEQQLGRLFQAAKGGPISEERSRDFSQSERKKAANEGAALSDGSFPIYSQKDAENAARLRGNGSASEAAVVAHIKKRVKALGLKMPAGLAGDGDE